MASSQLGSGETRQLSFKKGVPFAWIDLAADPSNLPMMHMQKSPMSLDITKPASAPLKPQNNLGNRQRASTMKLDSPLKSDKAPFQLSPEKPIELPQISISRDVLFNGLAREDVFGSKDLNPVKKLFSNPLGSDFKFPLSHQGNGVDGLNAKETNSQDFQALK